MSDQPNEFIKQIVKELDALADGLDFMAEAHPHGGGRYVLIHLSDRATGLAYDLRKQFELLKTDDRVTVTET